MSTVTLHTESGSTYEVDVDGKRIRRLGNTGGSDPTPHTGTDGVWKRYEAIGVHLALGGRRALVIRWNDDEVTRTSRLVVEDEAAALAALTGRTVT